MLVTGRPERGGIARIAAARAVEGPREAYPGLMRHSYYPLLGQNSLAHKYERRRYRDPSTALASLRDANSAQDDSFQALLRRQSGSARSGSRA